MSSIYETRPESPLELACRHGRLEEVKHWAATNPSMLEPPPCVGHYTPLQHAARHNRIEVVRFLVRQPQVKLDSKDWRGWTALFWASGYGYKHVANVLASVGASPNSDILHYADALTAKAVGTRTRYAVRYQIQVSPVLFLRI